MVIFKIELNLVKCYDLVVN